MSLMLEEIHEQPVVLDRTLRAERAAAEEIRKALTERRPRAIILAARGTSDNAAQFGRYLLELKTGIPVSLSAPSIITLYGREVDYRDCLVVAISQSGESTDTNLVLEAARRQGAVTVGITNEPASSLTLIAEHLLLVHAGRERSVAATKTYTGQMMALYLLAWALGADIDIDDLDRISSHAAAALRTEDEIARLAERYRFMDSTVVIGRGLNYANAFEFALKLMETCAVVAERFSSADFLHGPIAMLGQQFPVFAFVPGGPTWATMRLMIEKVRETTTETLLVTDQSNLEATELSRRCVVIPDHIADETLTPIPYIIPAQLFAARLADEKGMDADHPRGLAKVTRTL
jgi:glucosamine--fructose-6-phosphate aminotransferase (isomerizing)